MTTYSPIVKQANDVVRELIIAKSRSDIRRLDLVSRCVEQSVASIAVRPVDISPDASNILVLASFLVSSRSETIIVVSQSRPISDLFGIVMLRFISV